jgi:GntR family transcriptional regulator
METSFTTDLERGPDAAPLYRQITHRLLDLAKGMVPGSRFPTDRELIDSFGVSRITVNQAVQSLVNSGYLKRQQGKGTFVTRPVFKRTELRLNSFSEDTVAMGYKPGAKLISHRVIEPEEEVRQMLGLVSGEDVLYLERLMSADGEIIALLYTYLPIKLCKNFDEWFTAEALDEVSLYAILERQCGYNLADASETIEAVNASDREAGLLGVFPGAALLWLRRLTYLEDHTPLEYSHLVYRGDRYKMDLTTRRR